MPSALQSIVDWAENELSAWQSDAVRRILTQDELDESDKKDASIRFSPQLPKKIFLELGIVITSLYPTMAV